MFESAPGRLIASSSSRHTPGRGQWPIAAVAVASLLGVYFVAAPVRPIWLDEVQWIDPGVNLARGQGFTSTAWHIQPRTHFFAGNTPLYAFSIAAWVSLCGFTPGAVHLLHFVWIGFGALTTWHAARRARMIDSPVAGLVLLLVLVSEPTLASLYFWSRYDCLHFALGGAAFWVATHAASRARSGVLLFLGGLMAWAGLQFLVYVPLVAGLALVVAWFSSAVRGRKKERAVAWDALAAPAALVMLGQAIGWLALVGVYWHFGVLGEFFASLRGNPWLDMPNHTLVTDRPWEKLSRIPWGALYAEPGLWASGALCLFVIVVRAGLRNSGARVADGSPTEAHFARTAGGPNPGERVCVGWAMFGLLAALLFPGAVALAGPPQGWYRWLAVAASWTAALAAIERLPRLGLRRVGMGAAIVGCATAGFFGIGTMLHERRALGPAADVTQVTSEAARFIEPDDWVFCETPVYYAVRSRAAMTFVWSGLPSLNPNDAARINVLIVRDRQNYVNEVLSRIGGAWRPTGQRLSAADHQVRELVVLRRAAAVP